MQKALFVLKTTMKYGYFILSSALFSDKTTKYGSLFLLP